MVAARVICVVIVVSKKFGIVESYLLFAIVFIRNPVLLI